MLDKAPLDSAPALRIYHSKLHLGSFPTKAVQGVPGHSGTAHCFVPWEVQIQGPLGLDQVPNRTFPLCQGSRKTRPSVKGYSLDLDGKCIRWVIQHIMAEAQWEELKAAGYAMFTARRLTAMNAGACAPRPHPPSKGPQSTG